MIRIEFDRMAEHASFRGYRTHGGDPYFDMCRTLVTRQWPDDEAVFVDERGMACITVRSFHSCARRYRPTDEEKAARSERAQAKIGQRK